MTSIVPIVGHPDYRVGDDGRVFSVKRGWHELKAQPDQDGYLHVVLSTAGRLHTIKVQRLVAEHFLGPRPAGTEVCHRNGIKTNNSVSNLRYGTHQSNILDKALHGTQTSPAGEINGNARLTEVDVRAIWRDYADGQGTQREIAARFGISREQARDIINRKAWAHVA